MGGADYAEIVCDRISDFSPSTGDFGAQEVEHRVGEFAIGGIGPVVGQRLVHHGPQPLDRVQMRAVGGDEMQLDASAGAKRL